MATVIGWLLMILPFVLPLLKKVLPKLFLKLGALIGGLLGGSAAGAAKVGVLATVVGFLAKIVSWLSRFPAWLKGLFAAGGAMAWASPFFLFLLNLAKTPILLGIMFVVSSIFPTFIEKIFLVVGAVCLRMFLWIFKLGKGVFVGALNQAGSSGGSVVDEFRDSVLNSFDELPPCMVEIMGYLHLVEDLGLIVTTAALLAIVSVFKIVYGGFFTKSGGPLI